MRNRIRRGRAVLWELLGLAGGGQRCGRPRPPQPDHAELEAFVADMRMLMRDPGERRLMWKYGLGPAMREESCKLAELRNWLEVQVLPYARRRR